MKLCYHLHSWTLDLHAEFEDDIYQDEDRRKTIYFKTYLYRNISLFWCPENILPKYGSRVTWHPVYSLRLILSEVKPLIYWLVYTYSQSNILHLIFNTWSKQNICTTSNRRRCFLYVCESVTFCDHRHQSFKVVILN